MYLSIPFTDKKAAVYISLAEAGDMGANTEPEAADRAAFFRSTGIMEESSFPLVLEQVHSHIIYDAAELEGRHGLLQGDGMISRSPRAMAVSVADCVPIFLYDTRSGAMGAFHSGWKGTGIAAEGARRMVDDYGCRMEDIEAVIGPAIGGCCYQVERERYEFFLNTFGTVGLKNSKNSYSLDLKLINFNILSKLNLKNIIVSEECTCCDRRFFSYRRAMAEGAHFSRMLAYINILE